MWWKAYGKPSPGEPGCDKDGLLRASMSWWEDIPSTCRIWISNPAFSRVPEVLNKTRCVYICMYRYCI